tara:strand:- start:925 stop:3081 length:2157 start_codon:yes stop_codon:yes gene_type:complete
MPKKQKKDNKFLLLEGGFGGHMFHLYDNIGLTFNKMKEIMVAAADGNLEGTEKTDGQNLFISFSVREGVAKAVRNKEEIRGGGLDAEGLGAKFADRGNLTKAFTDGFAAFEKSISGMSSEQLETIFGENANIFYNSEVMDPRNANVILYDDPRILIHREGHVSIDYETAKIEPFKDAKAIGALDDALRLHAKKHNQGDFRVEINALKKLEALDDDTILINTFQRLEAILNEYDIHDDDTILDFLVERVSRLTFEQLPDLPVHVRVLLIKRILKVPGVSLTDIRKVAGKELYTKIKEFIPDKDAINAVRYKAIWPIEDIVHDFTVELLKALRSLFVLDHDKEVARLKDKLSYAIAAIEGVEVSSRYPEALDVLKKQMEKIKDVENISTAAEGFVFSYDGYTYKFTGNFAPLNQILGMFKYGRGKVPSLKNLLWRLDFEKETETPEGEEKAYDFAIPWAGQEGTRGIAENEDPALRQEPRTIALFPGGFKPPHAGHYSVVEELRNLPHVDEVRVLISRKSRFEDVLEIDKYMSQKVWQIYTKHIPKVHIEVTDAPSPIGASYEFLKQVPSGTTVVFATGEKDAEDRQELMSTLKAYGKAGGRDVEVETVTVPDYEGMSATDIRKCIVSNKDDDLYQCLPRHLSEEDIVKIREILTGPIGLEEASSMAAGNVAGAAGVSHNYKRDDDDEEEDCEEEDELVNTLIREVFKYLIKESPRGQKE